MENKKHFLGIFVHCQRMLLIITTIAYTLPLYAIDINVSAFENLQAAIIEFNGNATENTTIVVGENFGIASALNITNTDYTLTITSDETTHTLMRSDGFVGNMFLVGNNAKLVIENIVIDGNGSIVVNSGVLVRISSGGTLIINNGAVLQNNTNDNTYGSCVSISSGTLTMTGGTIRDNSCLYNIGAGIYASGSSTFTMTGGVISGNTAQTGGGVYFGGANSVFTMTGGTISGNSASVGGGVYFGGTNSVFTMIGGTISGNNARTGGGVAFGGTSTTLAMSDGDRTLNLGGTAAIKDNTRGTGDGAPPSNLYLANDRYIVLGADAAESNDIVLPATGMEIWVQTATTSGIIVQSGATASCVQWFHADNGKIVIHDSGTLAIEN